MKGAGTLRWQSPELWDGESSKTPQSDVYAFGMTIAEVGLFAIGRGLDTLNKDH